MAPSVRAVAFVATAGAVGAAAAAAGAGFAASAHSRAPSDGRSLLLPSLPALPVRRRHRRVLARAVGFAVLLCLRARCTPGWPQPSVPMRAASRAPPVVCARISRPSSSVRARAAARLCSLQACAAARAP
eukprot:6174991-Pleurochrysis_carterae.AAC.1